MSADLLDGIRAAELHCPAGVAYVRGRRDARKGTIVPLQTMLADVECATHRAALCDTCSSHICAYTQACHEQVLNSDIGNFIVQQLLDSVPARDIDLHVLHACASVCYIYPRLGMDNTEMSTRWPAVVQACNTLQSTEQYSLRGFVRGAQVDHRVALAVQCGAYGSAAMIALCHREEYRRFLRPRLVIPCAFRNVTVHRFLDWAHYQQTHWDADDHQALMDAYKRPAPFSAVVAAVGNSAHLADPVARAVVISKWVARGVDVLYTHATAMAMREPAMQGVYMHCTPEAQQALDIAVTPFAEVLTRSQLAYAVATRYPQADRAGEAACWSISHGYMDVAVPWPIPATRPRWCGFPGTIASALVARLRNATPSDTLQILRAVYTCIDADCAATLNNDERQLVLEAGAHARCDHLARVIVAVATGDMRLLPTSSAHPDECTNDTICIRRAMPLGCGFYTLLHRIMFDEQGTVDFACDSDCSVCYPIGDRLLVDLAAQLKNICDGFPRLTVCESDRELLYSDYMAATTLHYAFHNPKKCHMNPPDAICECIPRTPIEYWDVRTTGIAVLMSLCTDKHWLARLKHAAALYEGDGSELTVAMSTARLPADGYAVARRYAGCSNFFLLLSTFVLPARDWAKCTAHTLARAQRRKNTSQLASAAKRAQRE